MQPTPSEREALLYPDDRVVSIDYPKLSVPKEAISALDALMKITRSPSVDEIGEHGPPVAAVVTAENKDVAALQLFETLFGRDSLIVSLFVLPQFPKLAYATILALAKLQGVRVNDAAEEEAGRIMHEYRDSHDPIGVEITEKLGWQFPYFGSVDATPLFVMLLTEYVAQEGSEILNEKYTDRNAHEAIILDALDRAMAWIITRVNSNNEGFLEFCRANPLGIDNQVWKDSYDSYFHADGTIANHLRGIASVEVQGYAYDALLGAADLYQMLESGVMQGRYSPDHIALLRMKAEALRQNTFRHMWREDDRGGYFAIGTDRSENNDVRTMAIRTSNMGHLLSSRMLEGSDPEIARKRMLIVDTLMGEEFLNAGGIRTLSQKECRFTPGGYHNGSVWLWDTYMIARGMRKHGFGSEADALERRIVASIEATHKYPEFVRGGDAPCPEINQRVIDIWSERDQRHNRIEQPPQEVQAWTVAAVSAIEYERAKRAKSGGVTEGFLDKR